jgi:hypothetical protein
MHSSPYLNVPRYLSCSTSRSVRRPRPLKPSSSATSYTLIRRCQGPRRHFAHAESALIVEPSSISAAVGDDACHRLSTACLAQLHHWVSPRITECGKSVSTKQPPNPGSARLFVQSSRLQTHQPRVSLLGDGIFPASSLCNTRHKQLRHYSGGHNQAETGLFQYRTTNSFPPTPFPSSFSLSLIRARLPSSGGALQLNKRELQHARRAFSTSSIHMDGPQVNGPRSNSSKSKPIRSPTAIQPAKRKLHISSSPTSPSEPSSSRAKKQQRQSQQVQEQPSTTMAPKGEANGVETNDVSMSSEASEDSSASSSQDGNMEASGEDLKGTLTLSRVSTTAPAAVGQDSVEWQATIEKVVKNVVAIHFCQTCSFDTDSAVSSEATGFVVDAEKGYILTNRVRYNRCSIEQSTNSNSTSSEQVHSGGIASLTTTKKLTSIPYTETPSMTLEFSDSTLKRSNTCHSLHFHYVRT